MIPRLGDGNKKSDTVTIIEKSLENDSPSRGRKPVISDNSKSTIVFRK